jgi:alpha-beta hydrolase superfamily lysophospholipase
VGVGRAEYANSLHLVADHAVLHSSEAAKSVIREGRQLCERWANGLSSAVVHLVIEPVLVVTRNQSFGGIAERLHGMADAATRAKNRPEGEVAPVERPAVSPRGRAAKFSDLLEPMDPAMPALPESEASTPQASPTAHRARQHRTSQGCCSVIGQFVRWCSWRLWSGLSGQRSSSFQPWAAEEEEVPPESTDTPSIPPLASGGHGHAAPSLQSARVSRGLSERMTLCCLLAIDRLTDATRAMIALNCVMCVCAADQRRQRQLDEGTLIRRSLSESVKSSAMATSQFLRRWAQLLKIEGLEGSAPPSSTWCSCTCARLRGCCGISQALVSDASSSAEAILQSLPGGSRVAQLFARRPGPVPKPPPLTPAERTMASLHSMLTSKGHGGSLAARVASSAHGIAARTYRVRTADGYLLRLVRLPRAESSRVVYFQHGLLDSASAWVASGAMYGLALRAWAEGFDVFLGNLRGTADSLDDDEVDHHPSAPPPRAAPTSSGEGGVAGLAGASGSAVSLTVVEGVHDALGEVTRLAETSDSDVSESRSGSAGEDTELVKALIPEGGDGDGSDMLLGHAWISRDSQKFWQYSVDDHTLDVMAHIDAVRDLKASESTLRRQAVETRLRELTSALRSLAARKLAVEAIEQEAFANLSPDTSSTDEFQQRLKSAKVRQGRAEARVLVCQRALRMMGYSEGDGLPSPLPESRSDGSPYRSASFMAHLQEAGDATEPPSEVLRAAEPPAYTAAVADVRIVGVGHSMGGCLLLTHILHSRALRRPHGLSGSVLLSPAGLHRDVGTAPRVILTLVGLLAMKFAPDGPFPMRSSRLQRIAAGLLQDLKRTQGTGDLVASIAAMFFGGTMSNFAFHRISLLDYPLGGTSVRVMTHGCKSMFAADLGPFDYSPEENLKRYGVESPESYRHDYGLIDVPTDFVAGGLDMLIPPSNLKLQAAAVHAASPGMAGYTEFPTMGHLDFTLGVSDEVISHVMERLDRMTNTTDHALPEFPLDVDALCESDSKLSRVVRVIHGRSHEGVSPAKWLPASECARQYKFLNCYDKRHVAFRGLDRRHERLWELFPEAVSTSPSSDGDGARPVSN